MTERVAKRHKTSCNFADSLKDLFDACFTRPSDFASILAKHQLTTIHAFIGTQNDETVYFTFVCVLNIQFRRYNAYIDKPPRFVPFLRPLFTNMYVTLRLCLRQWRIPIDIVWMILERMGLVIPITKDTIRNTLLLCMRHSDYLYRRHVKPTQNSILFPDKQNYCVWGESLIDNILKEGSFINDREGL